MNKKAVGIALAVIFLLGLVFMSFLDSNQTPAVAEEKAPATKAAPAPAPAAPVKEVTFDGKKVPKVIATVNKVDIPRDNFVRMMTNLVGQMKSHGQPVTAEWLKGVQTQVLDRMITVEVLSQDAAAQKVKVGDKEVQEQMDRIKKTFPSDAEYKKGLKEQGISEKELKADIRKNLAIRRLLEEKVAAAVTVSDAEAKKYYDEHQKEFERPEMVHARHIILLLDAKADDAKKAEVDKKMAEIQEKLKGGAKFEDLAKEYSQDASAQNGGDLGFFPKGAMVKEFEEAVWNMKEGAVSDVITTQFGKHLVKFEERKPGGTVSYAEVKDDLTRGLEHEKKNSVKGAYINDLKARAKIKTNL